MERDALEVWLVVVDADADGLMLEDAERLEDTEGVRDGLMEGVTDSDGLTEDDVVPDAVGVRVARGDCVAGIDADAVKVAETEDVNEALALPVGLLVAASDGVNVSDNDAAALTEAVRDAALVVLPLGERVAVADSVGDLVANTEAVTVGSTV
jgi:hypothetical protein